MRSFPPSLLLVSVLVFGLGLAACAGDGDGPQDRHGARDAFAPHDRGDSDDGPPPPATDTLFISPAGKPFHGRVGQPYPVVAWFAEADADHDGKLTREEFRADFAAFFRQLDINHDGVIDGFELANYEQTVAPEVLPRLAQIQGNFPGERGDSSSQNNGQNNGQGDGQGPPTGGRRHGGGQGGPGGGQGGGGQRQLAQAQARGNQAYDGAPAYSLFNVSEPVSGADANFDGRVTLEEFLAAADRRFDQLDKDHLGYLTLSALPRTPEQIAVEGRHKKAPGN